jgi:hypothetical protein
MPGANPVDRQSANVPVTSDSAKMTERRAALGVRPVRAGTTRDHCHDHTRRFANKNASPSDLSYAAERHAEGDTRMNDQSVG